MENCKVELISSVIRELRLSVGYSDTVTSEICVSYTFKVCEPKDPADPTVMLIAEVTVTDTATDRIDAKFTMECIFNLDPIPEDRKVVAKTQCSDIVQNKAVQMLHTILSDAGHKIAIRPH